MNIYVAVRQIEGVWGVLLTLKHARTRGYVLGRNALFYPCKTEEKATSLCNELTMFGPEKED